ncbi:hypothetical protein ACOSQ4_031402 [Xanthoceras sorbifolium]
MLTQWKTTVISFIKTIMMKHPRPSPSSSRSDIPFCYRERIVQDAIEAFFLIRATSRHHHHQMDGGDVDNDDGGMEPPAYAVSCSICLDVASDNGGRSRAKLRCGHEFHLGIFIIYEFV